MPPHGHSHSSHSSHHSSSHHSSSHHSSYHSSSSHSSSPRSSSYSRSYSSGPSSHSTSSYTSRPSTRFTRQRTNQPRGYNGSVPGYSPARRHHCVKHDYMYFPVSWVDEKTNTHYRKGYYDEMGNHYDDIAFKKNGEYTASFHCDYCDSDLKYAWKEGAAPKCPNCGAELNEMGIVTDEIVEEPVGAGNSASIAKKIVIGYFSIVFGFMFLGCIGSIASNAFGSHEYNDYG